jgi:hypothetical protein
MDFECHLNAQFGAWSQTERISNTKQLYHANMRKTRQVPESTQAPVCWNDLPPSQSNFNDGIITWLRSKRFFENQNPREARFSAANV